MIAVQLCDDSISKTARRQQIIDGLHEIPSMIRKVLGMDKALQQLAKDMLAKEKSTNVCTQHIVTLGMADKIRRDVLGGCLEDQGSLLHA